MISGDESLPYFGLGPANKSTRLQAPGAKYHAHGPCVVFIFTHLYNGNRLFCYGGRWSSGEGRWGNRVQCRVPKDRVLRTQ
jgi:hypothetical protein